MNSLINPSTEFPNNHGEISLIRLTHGHCLLQKTTIPATFRGNGVTYQPYPEIFICDKNSIFELNHIYPNKDLPYLVVIWRAPAQHSYEVLQSGKATEANLDQVREIIRKAQVESGLLPIIDLQINPHMAEQMIREGDTSVICEYVVKDLN